MRTNEQTLIIEHDPARHALVSAVPGSGKTTVLVDRIDFLVKRGVPPEQILVLMFNTSARDQFIQRLASKTGIDCPVATFHGAGYALLGSLQADGLLPDGLTLGMEKQIEEIAAEALKSVLSEDERQITTLLCQETGLLMKRIQGTVEQRKSSRVDQAVSVFEQLCKERGVITYADMIKLPLDIARADALVRRRWAKTYQHILVDEFQDVSEDQIELVKMLASQGARVMAVGDEDQSIYDWRGAQSQYMGELFDCFFPSTSRYTLSVTFRFGDELAIASSRVIGRNKQRRQKVCVSAKGRPTAVNVVPTSDAAKAVLARVEEWASAHRDLANAVVLVREFAQARPIELEALRRGLPVRVDGVEPLSAVAPFDLIWAWLGLWVGGNNVPESLRRLWVRKLISKLPREAADRAAFESLATTSPESIRDALAAAAQRGAKSLNMTHAMSSRATLDVLSKCRGLGQAGLGEFLRAVVAMSGAFEAARKANRKKQCDLISSFVKTTESYPDQIEWFDRMTDNAFPGTDDANALLLTSMHRAKGLEWPLVIMAGLEEGVFPRSVSNPNEDRRLFYVAMTRAIEELVMVTPADFALIDQLQRGRAPVPGSVCYASRYVFEADVRKSKMVAAALLRQEGELDAEVAEQVNRYLKQRKEAFG